MRIIIMACYIPTGEIEEFKKKLIEMISVYADYFIIASNGAVSKQTYSFFNEYASSVLIRENIGYDGGAYKDVISGLDLDRYDELLLMNDTFYGFFYPLDVFFEQSQNAPNVDFWGLTRFSGGFGDYGEYVSPHIQGYFLLVKSSMLHSDAFRLFWDTLEYPMSYTEAICNFEVRFTTFFQEFGFRGDAYCRLETIGIKDTFNKIVYIKNPYELIRDLHCPVLKRKSCRIENQNAWKAIKYIRENNLYDVEIIFNQILLDYKNGVISSYFNLYDLEIFLNRYDKVYIYGKGRYGLTLYEYLECRNKAIEKFIVSSKEGQEDDGTIEISELPKGSDYGIILAMKPQFTQEVLGNLLHRISIGQLFYVKPKDR